MSMKLKRLFSVLLCAAMLFGLMPVSAQAASLGSTISITEINPHYRDVVCKSDLKQPQHSGAMAVDNTAEYLTSVEEIATEIRNGLRTRQETIAVYYQTDHYSKNELQDQMKAFFKTALLHTGVPTEGDYLQWQYAGYQASASGTTRNGVYQFEIKYTVTYYTTAAQEAEVDAEISALLRELDLEQASNYQKLCGIYDYICQNVTYAYDNLNDSSYKLKYTAYGALINRTAVCQGYAVLLYRLALELGVDCRLIPGSASGENHGWNLAQLGEQYYNLDATWDAGKSSYSYFLRGSENFGNHVRDAAYTTAEFEETYPTSTTDFVNCAGMESGNATHSYRNVVTKPTCVEGGYTTYTCAVCGDTYVDDVTAAAGHDYEAVVTAPTCTEKGYTTYTCAFCGECYVGDETEPVDHDYEAVVTAPTCTEKGYTTYTCTFCGECYVGDEKEPVDHDYEAVVTAPTCTEKGYTTYTCAFCGECYVGDETEPVDHDYEVVVTAPTCAEKGYTTYTCRYCGKSYRADETDMVNHSYGTWYTVTEASCTESGEERRDCAHCDAYETRQTAETGHHYQDHVCTNCGATQCLASGTCGNSLTWTLDYDEVLTITGTGKMASYASPNEVPWTEYRDRIAEIFVEDGVTAVSDYAFYDCDVTTIQLGETVAELGAFACYACANLQDLILPECMETIGSRAFADSGLEMVIFYGEAPSFGAAAFDGVTATCYYPADRASWKEAVLQDYEGELVWTAYWQETPEVVEQPVTQRVVTGTSATFRVDAVGFQLSYQWQYQTSATGTWKNATASGNRTAVLTVPGTIGRTGYQYRCVLTDYNGNTTCTEAASLYVLGIQSQPTAQQVADGDTADFTVSVTTDSCAYQWQYQTSETGTWKNCTATGNKTSNLMVSATVKKDGYRYRCRITDEVGNQITTKTVSLSVLGVKSGPSAVYIKSGKMASFHVSASGCPNAYQWQYKTSESGKWKNCTANGNRTPDLSVAATTGKNGYFYRCRITDDSGNQIYTAVVRLYVLGVKTQPSSQTVSAGDSAKFQIKATGGDVTYRWQYRTSASGSWKNTTASGYRTAQLHVSAAKYKNGYQYRCKMTDAAGNVLYSKAAKLIVLS